MFIFTLCPQRKKIMCFLYLCSVTVSPFNKKNLSLSGNVCQNDLFLNKRLKFPEEMRLAAVSEGFLKAERK